MFQVSAVCLASYAAGMLAVIGSTMVATHLMYLPTSDLRPAGQVMSALTSSNPPEVWPDPSDMRAAYLEGGSFLNSKLPVYYVIQFYLPLY